MPKLELNIVGDIPSELDLEPVRRVIAQLNEPQPDWLKPGIVNLKLVDDAEIQALNRDYSGNDYATDVLSFSYRDEAVGGRDQAVVSNQDQDQLELGDMVISIETAARQADEAGTSLADELATLTLHGVLHIDGFDHAALEDQKAMDQLQRQILTAAGVTYRNFNWINESH